MLGFIGGVLFGSVVTVITMCLLMAGKEESEDEDERNEFEWLK